MATQDEVVIAILGVTGAGKSSLVKRITKSEKIYVEDGLSSGTEDVQAYNFHHKGIKFVIIDTPGFNDSRTSNDEKVVDRLLTWLESSYKQGTRLNGLVYLHRVSDPRMAGSAMRNLSIFRKLCGSNNFKNVILGTTFWERVDSATGSDRERELATSSEMWGSMVKKGSKMVRILQDRRSNLAIFEDIARNNAKIVVEAQKEMLAGKSRNDTAAALDSGTIVNAVREQQRQEWIRELLILSEKERKREQIRQQEIADMKAETERRRKSAQALAAKEAILATARIEKDRKSQRQREQRQREELRLEAGRLQALADEARKKQQAEERKQKKWREHVCDDWVDHHDCCSSCRDRLNIGKSYYHHCCFCDHDSYNSCSSCGSKCLDRSHPPMKTRRTVHKDCTVM